MVALWAPQIRIVYGELEVSTEHNNEIAQEVHIVIFLIYVLIRPSNLHILQTFLRLHQKDCENPQVIM